MKLVRAPSNIKISVRTSNVGILDMNSNNALHFEPPEHGLLPGEELIWQKYPGISFPTIFCGGCVPLLAVIPGIFIIFFLGEIIGYTFLSILLVVFVMMLRRFIIERRTMYYITSERVVYAVGGRMIQAIFLDHLEGHPKEDYLEIEQTHVENGSSVYKVIIKDPGSPLEIKLKNVQKDIAETFEKLGETKTCPQCNHPNIAVRKHCKQCGSRLR